MKESEISVRKLESGIIEIDYAKNTTITLNLVLKINQEIKNLNEGKSLILTLAPHLRSADYNAREFMHSAAFNEHRKAVAVVAGRKLEFYLEDLELPNNSSAPPIKLFDDRATAISWLNSI